MKPDSPYFFCGIGGSGMMPLALIVKARGGAVAGSDRSLDQGRLAPKFEYLQSLDIALFPQDGSGITDPAQILVTSAAVEDTVPDVVAAIRLGARRLGRAELLSSLFNQSGLSIGIAGTSGKSTTTGMVAWMLHVLGRDPTVMNGAVMKNFATPDAPFASALVGKGEAFVAEVDESDGSIARYDPTIAVLNNVAHDHKSMEELRILFAGFLSRAKRAVVNADNEEAMALAPSGAITFGLSSPAMLRAEDLAPTVDGIGFTFIHDGLRQTVRLKVPGRHNVANALAALGGAVALDLPLAEAARALEGFEGIKRRLEWVGSRNGITVIDDFAHNPDKIAASLETLKAFPGRLLILFQPHGFGPLKLMKDGFIQAFAQGLGPEDVLVMPEPAYFGGTVDRSVSSPEIVEGLRARGIQAETFAERPASADRLVALARPGDRIVVMGARDDTLSVLAAEMLARCP